MWRRKRFDVSAELVEFVRKSRAIRQAFVSLFDKALSQEVVHASWPAEMWEQFNQIEFWVLKVVKAQKVLSANEIPEDFGQRESIERWRHSFKAFSLCPGGHPVARTRVLVRLG